MINTPTQENEELLPCPFCKQPLRDEGKLYWHPRTDCYLATTFIRKSDIRRIREWNTRPSPSTVSNGELVEQIKNEIQELSSVLEILKNGPRS
jgi:hypothetical protein